MEKRIWNQFKKSSHDNGCCRDFWEQEQYQQQNLKLQSYMFLLWV